MGNRRQADDCASEFFLIRLSVILEKKVRISSTISVGGLFKAESTHPPLAGPYISRLSPTPTLPHSRYLQILFDVLN